MAEPPNSVKKETGSCSMRGATNEGVLALVLSMERRPPSRNLIRRPTRHFAGNQSVRVMGIGNTLHLNFSSNCMDSDHDEDTLQSHKQ